MSAPSDPASLTDRRILRNERTHNLPLLRKRKVRLSPLPERRVRLPLLRQGSVPLPRKLPQLRLLLVKRHHRLTIKAEMKLCWGMKQGAAVLLSAVLLLAQLHWCGNLYLTESGESCPESLALHSLEHSDHDSALHAPDEDCHQGCHAALCNDHPTTDFSAMVSQLQPDIDLIAPTARKSLLHSIQRARVKRLFHLVGSPPTGPPRKLGSRGPPTSLLSA